MPASVQVDVLVASNIADVPDEADIRRWLGQAITRTGATGAVEVSVKVVDEEEGRALNSQYRGKDYATNVLSFPLMDAATAGVPAGPPLALGDIVICGPVVAREAGEQGIASRDHWAHMLVHGALHLLGYDHETDEQATEMESLEALILADGGVQNPYAAEIVQPVQP
jgi:probable rRNA maturation factor